MIESNNPKEPSTPAQNVVGPTNTNGHAIRVAAIAARASAKLSAIICGPQANHTEHQSTLRQSCQDRETEGNALPHHAPLDGTDTNRSGRAHECPQAKQPLPNTAGLEHRAKPAVVVEELRRNTQVELEKLQADLEISNRTAAILADSCAEKDEALNRSNLHVGVLESKLEAAGQLAAESVRVCKQTYDGLGLNAPNGMPTTQTSQEHIGVPSGSGAIQHYSGSPQEEVRLAFRQARNLADSPTEVDGHMFPRRSLQSPARSYDSVLRPPGPESRSFAAGTTHPAAFRGTRDARSLSPNAHEKHGDNGAERPPVLPRARAHIPDPHRVTVQKSRWDALNTELSATKAQLAAARLEANDARAHVIRLEQRQENDRRNWRGLNNKAKRVAQESLERTSIFNTLRKSCTTRQPKSSI